MTPRVDGGGGDDADDKGSTCVLGGEKDGKDDRNESDGKLFLLVPVRLVSRKPSNVLNVGVRSVSAVDTDEASSVRLSVPAPLVVVDNGGGGDDDDENVGVGSGALRDDADGVVIVVVVVSILRAVAFLHS